MKAVFEQISGAGFSSIAYRRHILPRFNARFHYHPEVELTLIERSNGKRYVGGHVAHFEPGDLVLLGSNLPHCWLNAEEGEPIPGAAQSIVIQFRTEIFGETFWSLPEMNLIEQLLKKAQAGLIITGKTHGETAKKMQAGMDLSGFPLLLHVMDILYGIATSDEVEVIDPFFSSLTFSNSETERFQLIYAYLIDNFRDNITLEDIAQVANLSPTAFCRYFKKIARKTFVDTLTEFRLKHACHLLSSSERAIADICFDSGFGNLSYFNKEFKKALGTTPLAYRRMFG